eukprot:142737-Hanusia_phi.AAC.4
MRNLNDLNVRYYGESNPGPAPGPGSGVRATVRSLAVPCGFTSLWRNDPMPGSRMRQRERRGGGRGGEGEKRRVMRGRSGERIQDWTMKG